MTLRGHLRKHRRWCNGRGGFDLFFGQKSIRTIVRTSLWRHWDRMMDRGNGKYVSVSDGHRFYHELSLFIQSKRAATKTLVLISKLWGYGSWMMVGWSPQGWFNYQVYCFQAPNMGKYVWKLMVGRPVIGYLRRLLRVGPGVVSWLRPWESRWEILGWVVYCLNILLQVEVYYIYIHIYIYIFIYIYIYIHLYLHICIYIYTYTHIYIYMHTNIYIYMHTHMHVYRAVMQGFWTWGWLHEGFWIQGHVWYGKNPSVKAFTEHLFEIYGSGMVMERKRERERFIYIYVYMEQWYGNQIANICDTSSHIPSVCQIKGNPNCLRGIKVSYTKVNFGWTGTNCCCMIFILHSRYM